MRTGMKAIQFKRKRIYGRHPFFRVAVGYFVGQTLRNFC
jgi:hypothetical protein